MKGMIMLILSALIIWGFWMSWEWLKNRRKWEDKEPKS
jgi:hypothetical protein